MDFGTSDTYAAVPYSRSLHLATMRMQSRMHVAILAAEVPRTLPQWLQEYERFVLCCGAAAAKSYGRRWIFRTAMIAEMRASGVARLQVSAGDTVRDLQACFPDQHELLKDVGPGAEKLAAAMRAFCYRPRGVVYFTAYMCLFCNCTDLAAPELRTMAKSIRKTHRELDRTGLVVHPAVVLAEVSV